MFSIGAPSAQPAARSRSCAPTAACSRCRVGGQGRRSMLGLFVGIGGAFFSCLDRRSGSRARQSRTVAAHASRRRADGSACVGRPAGRRRARAAALRAWRKGNAGRQVSRRPTARPRSRPRSRCSPASSRASRRVRAHRPQACALLGLLRRGARAFAQRARQHGRAAGLSADRPCSCTRSAWRSGSGHCCRSLWACVMPAHVPRLPAAANSRASPTRSSR